MLWAEFDEQRARANLRKALSLLRKLLELELSPRESVWLISSGGAIRFATTGGDCWLDVAEFERLITPRPAPAQTGEGGPEGRVRASENQRTRGALSILPRADSVKLFMKS